MNIHTYWGRGGSRVMLVESWNLEGSSGGRRNSQKKGQLLGVLKKQTYNAGALKFTRKLWTYKNFSPIKKVSFRCEFWLIYGGFSALKIQKSKNIKKLIFLTSMSSLFKNGASTFNQILQWQRQTDMADSRLNRPSWPIWWKYFIETTYIFGISYVWPVYFLNLILLNTSNTKFIHRLNTVMVTLFLFAFFVF